MNIQLYLTIVAAFVTVDIYRDGIKYLRHRRVKTEMDRLFKEIEATINDIKSESKTDDKPRVRRNILTPVKN